jgi:hypothetical protein
MTRGAYKALEKSLKWDQAAKKIVFDQAQYVEDEAVPEDRRTIKVIKDMVNLVNERIKMVEVCPSNHTDA